MTKFVVVPPVGVETLRSVQSAETVSLALGMLLLLSLRGFEPETTVEFSATSPPPLQIHIWSTRERPKSRDGPPIPCHRLPSTDKERGRWGAGDTVFNNTLTRPPCWSDSPTAEYEPSAPSLSTVDSWKMRAPAEDPRRAMQLKDAVSAPRLQFRL
ncbi:unnamed protein product [Pleuronectes platessa]|uniref:Uncharacterized protein n=1 Tax=Pleuronectes platessa TaxID=8262 RepID=A0A9N7Z0R2_PLEPL|nr:unnamed protein product [Pleuronectes platessa]